MTTVPGYQYGSPDIARSPITLDELRQLEQAVGWSDSDRQALQSHNQIFLDKSEQMVDAWRAMIGKQEHLAKWFFSPDGKPDEDYKARVKQRFVKWVQDACLRPHDQAWLDYQEEIGLRHTPAKKNQTDGAHTPSVVPLRYLVAFSAMVVISTRPFFVEGGVAGENLQKLEDAWLKTVQLHITLWTRPYTREGLW
jgi:hypothetical protein